MDSAKDIVLKPITAQEANELVRRVHYSGKVVQNSQLHIGVFYNGNLEGAMQFGPSLDKRKIQGLVHGTGWNDFLELNRMAFSEALPRALGFPVREFARLQVMVDKTAGPREQEARTLLAGVVRDKLAGSPAA